MRTHQNTSIPQAFSFNTPTLVIWHLIHVRQGKTGTNAHNTATLHSGSPAAVCRHTSTTSYFPLFFSRIAKTIARPLQGERERKCLSIAGSENRDTGTQLQYTERVGQEQVVASSPSCCQVPQQKCKATRNREVTAARASIYTWRWKDTDSALSSLKHPSTRRTHTPSAYTSPCWKWQLPWILLLLKMIKAKSGRPAPPSIKTSDAIYFDFQSNPHSPYKSSSGFEWARLSLLFRQGCWCANLYQSTYVRVYVCTVATVTTLIRGLVCQ